MAQAITTLYTEDVSAYAKRRDTEGYRIGQARKQLADAGYDVKVYESREPFITGFDTREFYAVLPDGSTMEPCIFASDAYRRAYYHLKGYR